MSRISAKVILVGRVRACMINYRATQLSALSQANEQQLVATKITKAAAFRIVHTL
jgi:hypothetical protein